MTATATKERPIIFSGESVKAIMGGSKCMTRRAMKGQPDGDVCRVEVGPNGYCSIYTNPAKTTYRYSDEEGRSVLVKKGDPTGCIGQPCPYGEVGDLLYVKEAISKPLQLDVARRNFTGFYRASDEQRQVKWLSPLYMPRWASRLTLRITDVRVERVQDITEADAIAEGCNGTCLKNEGRSVVRCAGNGATPVEQFADRWDALNAKRDGGTYAWAKSPWVWALTFERV